MSAERFLLRPAELADVPALTVLIERSVRELQRADYTPAQREGALGHAFGVDTQLIKDRTYFVAEAVHHGNVLGGCGGWSRRRTLFGSDRGPGRSPALLDPACEPAKIRAIFVDPLWTRQGLGSLILQHCEQEARRAGFRSAEMGSTLTGVPLYALRGYREIGPVNVPLPNGETLPIVRMEKVL